MSDEEREAIDLLKNIDKQKCVMLECPVVKNNIERQLKIIELNRTIRKQSKEIEELKEKNKFLNWYFENQKDNFVHKDKIKAKIEELRKLDFGTDLVSQFTANSTTITILQSILEKE